MTYYLARVTMNITTKRCDINRRYLLLQGLHMKLLFDFFPLLIFFIVYKVLGIFYATGAIIIASAIQIAFMWLTTKRVEIMHVITFFLLLIFGGATILLHDAEFLKWKVSIVNWLFGIGFLASQVFLKTPFIQYIMGNSIELPKQLWKRLNLAWAGFFILMGCINIYVAYAFDTSVWVNFKVFGLLGLTLVFVVIQTLFLVKYLKETQSNEQNDP